MNAVSSISLYLNETYSAMLEDLPHAAHRGQSRVPFLKMASITLVKIHCCIRSSMIFDHEDGADCF